MMKTITKLFCTLSLIFFGLNVSGQDRKDVKISKNMKEALAERYKNDSHYASMQREYYKKEEWKKSWVGVKYSELIKKWGAPSRSFPDGDGGTVSVYENISSYIAGIYEPGYIKTATNGYGQTVVTGSKNTIDSRHLVTNTETTTVYVGKNNIITKIDWSYKSN